MSALEDPLLTTAAPFKYLELGIDLAHEHQYCIYIFLIFVLVLLHWRVINALSKPHPEISLSAIITQLALVLYYHILFPNIKWQVSTQKRLKLA